MCALSPNRHRIPLILLGWLICIPLFVSGALPSADAQPARYGLIFATGAGARFLEFYYQSTSRGVRGAMHSVAASVSSMLVGGALAHHLFRAFQAEVRVDGQPMQLERFTTMTAGGVRDIGLGFRPFLTAGERPGHFHWIATDLGGARFAMLVPGLRLGLRRALGALVHATARRVEVRASEPVPYTLDAELFAGVARFTLEAGPEICFLAA